MLQSTCPRATATGPLRSGIACHWQSESLRLGEFVAPADHPSFHDTGPISGCNIVFPRTHLYLRWSDGTRRWSDPAVLNFYNHGDAVERTCVEHADGEHGEVLPGGDRCVWLELQPSLLESLHARLRPQSLPERPFSVHQAPSNPSAYLAICRLIDRLQAAQPADPLWIEETAMAVVDTAIQSLEGRRLETLPAPSRRYRGCVEASRELIARDLAESPSLEEIAHAVDASPYQLARAFRAATGSTLHQYRLRLRLHRGVDYLLAGASDISAVAHELGFSSHSHFTATVRCHFRLTPSEIRLTTARGPAQ